MRYTFQPYEKMPLVRGHLNLGGTNPHESIYMLQHFMNNNFYKLNYQRLSTAALLLVLGISAVLAVFLWRQEKISAEEGI